MATKSQLSGMRGVYLVAAELAARGFIVSVTSRSAAGADLLVTDDSCTRAWSVQVKASYKPATYWLLGCETTTQLPRQQLNSDRRCWTYAWHVPESLRRSSAAIDDKLGA